MTERFSWLPLSHRKNIQLPKVVFEDYTDQNYGGWYDTDTNVILVVENPLWPEAVAATLAHEFRHSIQNQLGMYKRMGSFIRNDLEYEKQIEWYFTTFSWEYDALLYEYKYAKTDTNNWWLNHLVHNKKSSTKQAVFQY